MNTVILNEEKVFLNDNRITLDVNDGDIITIKNSIDMTTPSRYQVGDAINFSLSGENFIYGWVLCVKFYQGKIKYDLELSLDDRSSTRIYNIESVYIYPYIDNGTK